MTTEATTERAPDTDAARAEGVATTVVNQKGGTGKTTTTANCAASEALELAERLGVDPEELEGEILVIDLDAQCNLTRGLGLEANSDTKILSVDPERHGSLALLLDDECDPFPAIRRTRFGVDVIPGQPELTRLDASLALLGVPNPHDSLRKHVAQLKRRYRRVYMDCPGSLGMATINGLVAGDEIMVPVSPGQFELDGLNRLKETVRKAALAYRAGMKIDYVLVTDFDKREAIAQGTLTRVKEVLPGALLDSVVPRSVRVREAPGYGEPLCVYDRKGPADLGFRAVVREMAERRAARG